MQIEKPVEEVGIFRESLNTRVTHVDDSSLADRSVTYSPTTDRDRVKEREKEH